MRGTRDRSRAHVIFLRVFGVVTALVFCENAGLAATPLRSVSVSPDITIIADRTLPVPDHAVLMWDLGADYELSDLGTLPDAVAVDAYHRFAGTGARLLSFDTSVELSGAHVGPGDVVRYDGSSYTTVFRASDRGLPDGVNVDAVTVTAVGSVLLLSFDETVQLDGFTADDEDLVLVTHSGFNLAFDGSASGVPPGLDLDAAHLLRGNGHSLFSFDSAGTAGGVTFSDEDVVEYDPDKGTWEIALAASALGRGAVDLDALSARAVDDDGDGVGYLDDCDELDADVWRVPGEVRDLLLTHDGGANPATTLTWLAPADAGGTSLLYDVLRSHDAGDFEVEVGDCAESDSGATQWMDPTVPGAGTVLFFLIRGGNDCGEGTLGGERQGLACP